MKKKIEKCEFERKNICYALVCFSPQKCGAGTKDGKIRYADISSSKKKEKNTKNT